VDIPTASKAKSKVILKAPLTPSKASVPKETKPLVKKEAVKAKPLVKSEKLTPTKKSDTIGDMGNTKLIEPK
jgi:hypothetical protein